MEAEFQLMKPRIRSTHVHDNNGKDDNQRRCSERGGTIDWKNTMRLLRGGHDQFPLLLELKDRNDMPHPLDSVMEIFDRLENL